MKVKILEGASGRWIIVNAGQEELAWTGMRWAAHEQGIAKDTAQIANFDNYGEAELHALARGLSPVSYEIGADGKSITCRRCGMTSYYYADVENLYCGNCHIFHVPVLMA